VLVNYISALFSGIVIGIPLCFALGPVFFALIQNSLTNGFKSAFFIATGVILADILLFAAAYTGTHLFINDGMATSRDTVNFWVELCGGIVLLIMGFMALRKHVVETNQKRFFHNPVMYTVRGFALNFLNPANFFAWVVVTSNFNQIYISMPFRVVFYVSTLASVYITELLISYFAGRIRRVINDRFMHLISIVNGIIFIGCGLLLFATAFGISFKS
jgi:threonine/homoserine/homoserine lactone efflux protein